MKKFVVILIAAILLSAFAFADPSDETSQTQSLPGTPTVVETVE
ncbi:MAG: hypothetical protein PWP37_1822 [Thermotogota bacterium]|nr:hypothetical protein [Pseudothermotoga sp.]MDI3495919.1 hypothetical protein [Pseudothermotoga sp.]MDK2865630.1 hypothetical protein [Thermotogota bacterium]